VRKTLPSSVAAPPHPMMKIAENPQTKATACNKINRRRPIVELTGEFAFGVIWVTGSIMSVSAL